MCCEADWKREVVQDYKVGVDREGEASEGRGRVGVRTVKGGGGGWGRSRKLRWGSAAVTPPSEGRNERASQYEGGRGERASLLAMARQIVERQRIEVRATPSRGQG